MGVIFMRYRQHLVHTLLIYDLNSPNVSVRYDLGTVFARVRGGATFSNLSTFQIFPKFSLIFSPPNQNSLNYPKGGGVQTFMDFLHIFVTFYFDCFP